MVGDTKSTASLSFEGNLELTASCSCCFALYALPFFCSTPLAAIISGVSHTLYIFSSLLSPPFLSPPFLSLDDDGKDGVFTSFSSNPNSASCSFSSSSKAPPPPPVLPFPPLPAS